MKLSNIKSPTLAIVVIVATGCYMSGSILRFRKLATLFGFNQRSMLVKLVEFKGRAKAQ